MKIYFIMAVRGGVAEDAKLYFERLEAAGHEVHYPPRDAPQDDETGAMICEAHRRAMVDCDEVHVHWDVESKGSHFDLGMAYALGKPIVPVSCVHADPPGKSYWKAVINRT
jgi:nucleoside 2-deoxyribosyltransferase